MGKILLVGRLAARDLRRHKAQAVLLLLAIAAATTVLALGLALTGVTNQPYQQTRAATKGPDVVVYLTPASLAGGPGVPRPSGPINYAAQARTAVHSRGVIASSGPFPVSAAVLRVG